MNQFEYERVSVFALYLTVDLRRHVACTRQTIYDCVILRWASHGSKNVISFSLSVRLTSGSIGFNTFFVCVAKTRETMDTSKWRQSPFFSIQIYNDLFELRDGVRCEKGLASNRCKQSMTFRFTYTQNGKIINKSIDCVAIVVGSANRTTDIPHSNESVSW